MWAEISTGKQHSPFRHNPDASSNRAKTSKTRQITLIHYIFALAISLLPLLACQTATAAPAVPAAQEPPSAEAISGRYGFKSQDYGYLLFDPTKGTVLETHLADTPRIPASTTKVVVGLAALHILGPEYRFTTSLFKTGEVQAGTLHGDLYLRGGGDPGLSTDDLQHFVAALKDAGIQRVAGNFFFDESFLHATNAIDAKQPAAVSYNPGLSALSLNYNRVQLQWQHKPGGTNFRTAVWSPAKSETLRLKAIQTGVLPKGLDRRIKFLPSAPESAASTDFDRWLLSRKLPPKGWETLPVRTDPGRFAAAVFHVLCQKKGIRLPAPQPAHVPDSTQPVYIHHSKPLSKLLSGVLRYSNNLSAELIGQVAARRLSGRPVSLRESAALLTNWYRTQLPQTNWQEFVCINHSGLSSLSRHTPRQLAAILTSGWHIPKQGPARGIDFLSLLPIRGSTPDGRTTVRAKSGTMNYADGLAGYLTAESSRQLGFVILLTDFSRRAVLDAAFDIRFASASPGAQKWTKRAKRFERRLVKSWRQRY
jgi:D-alanyl-D-alanine carboxypeptidase/D-alanyl-D-alanine-endopeptidase (penicillin-binding protein 4)